jgi:putative membrane-bound dehydrogenase-like protein
MNLLAIPFLAALLQDVAQPAVTDDRLVLELVAREPDLNTPVGMCVDARGRVWAVESNTHFPPKGYKGKPTDRILIFSDFGPDGRARSIKEFAQGFRYAMGIIVAKNGDVYLATRADIFQIRSTKGDDQGDQVQKICRLETKGAYPHNGLSGFAFDPQGDLVFGLGENLGAAYSLVGSDGRHEDGGGEGGNIFRCRPDGSGLARIATGFWNPFHLCFDVYGRLFAVDNDPDSRPPCRLLHVVQGGDYGFRFRNGRKGLHPFTAWNGELPGTLPMASHTGEAPAGVLAYEADAFPAEYRGTLLGTSWGDHLIERYVLVPKGASFTSRPETIVKGGENFRPVGIGLAPDGSVFFTDWVDKSYELHGKGRLWRLRARTPGHGPVATNAPPDTPALKRMNEVLSISQKEKLPPLLPLLSDPDPFMVSAALETLSRRGEASLLRPLVTSSDPKRRLGALLVLRRLGDTQALSTFLEDIDPGVRRAAIQWVGEERLLDYAAALEVSASRSPVTKDIFEAYLASTDLLAGRSPLQVDQVGSELLIARMLDDLHQPPPLRALAMRMLRPTHPSVTVPKLEALLAGPDAGLRLEATRALAMRPDPAAQEALRRLVGDPALTLEVVAGLSHSAAAGPTRALLLPLLKSDRLELRMEAIRSLAGAADQPDVREALAGIAKEGGEAGEKAALVLRPRATEPDWLKIGLEPGDPAAGERVFLHPRGPQCLACHRVNGRGGIVGPDLSTIGNVLDRSRLVESIVEPSKEIAPMFVGWRVRTKKGAVVDGRILEEDPAPTGHVILINAEGAQTKVLNVDIDERLSSKISIMPDKLTVAMTPKEFRDLVTFLAGLK